MKTFYAIVWLTILAFLFLAILMQTSCSWNPEAYQAALPVGQAIQQASAEYGAACQRNYVPVPYYVPYQPVIQPLNIDTAFHPAPMIPRP